MQATRAENYSSFSKGGVSLHRFSNLNINDNMQNTANWINEQKLTRTQLISITLTENHINHGQTVFWVLTRDKPQDELDTPLPTILVKTFMKLDDWQSQANALTNFLETNRKVVVLTLCNVNEGTTDSNHQCLFYTEVEDSQPKVRYWLHQQKYSKSWEETYDATRLFLNDYLAPHQIVGLSTFQAHNEASDTAKEIDNRVFILHTAGLIDENKEKLRSSVIPQTGIYSFKLYSHPFHAKIEDRNAFYESILDAIIEKGVEQGWKLSVSSDTSNISDAKHSVVVSLWSWDQMVEQQLYEQLRPAGCCGCNIF